MNLVYRVTVNYQKFEFDDHTTADQFAALAKVNAIEDDKRTEVTVEYLTKEEANE